MSHNPESEDEASQEGLTPEQRLDASNTRLLNAGIVTIDNMETLQECVAYENQHQQRVPILALLACRAEELREES